MTTIHSVPDKFISTINHRRFSFLKVWNSSAYTETALLPPIKEDGEFNFPLCRPHHYVTVVMEGANIFYLGLWHYKKGTFHILSRRETREIEQNSFTKDELSRRNDSIFRSFNINFTTQNEYGLTLMTSVANYKGIVQRRDRTRRRMESHPLMMAPRQHPLLDRDSAFWNMGSCYLGLLLQALDDFSRTESNELVHELRDCTVEAGLIVMLKASLEGYDSDLGRTLREMCIQEDPNIAIIRRQEEMIHLPFKKLARQYSFVRRKMRKDVIAELSVNNMELS